MTQQPIHLALPKGRMMNGVVTLLADAGIQVSTDRRGYRPVLSVPGFETKLLKPQNILEMLSRGSRDLGFAGADWVSELELDLVELLDTKLDPVHIVAAAPATLLEDGELPKRPLVVATEYMGLAKRWVEKRGLDARLVRTYGATEVFPPEDADIILDNSATGQTLVANGLVIVDEVLSSSTRLYTHAKVLEDASKRERIERFVLLIQSVFEARERVMIDVNVSADCLDQVIKVLPCMREPTIANLYGQSGFAIKAAVPRSALPELLPLLKASGGMDIAVSALVQLVQ